MDLSAKLHSRVEVRKRKKAESDRGGSRRTWAYALKFDPPEPLIHTRPRGRGYFRPKFDCVSPNEPWPLTMFLTMRPPIVLVSHSHCTMTPGNPHLQCSALKCS